MKIKICGITNLQDAQAAVDAGADTLGFIFHRKSPRYIIPCEVKKIVERLPREIVTVGVFAYHSPLEVAAIVAESGVRMVQLHGGENPAEYRGLNLPLLQVMDGNENTVLEGDFIVADSNLAERKVGESKTDFRHLRNLGSIPREKLVISGGLTAETVGGLIAELRPRAVDVCSSVESAPGKKDHIRLRSFIEIAKRNLEYYHAG